MNVINEQIYEDFVPMPLDLQGWNSNNKIFQDLIIQVQPKTIIEVGTWKGASAINMGNIIKKMNLQCQLYCVDTWLGAEEFWNSLKDTPERNLLLKHGYPQIYYQFLSNVVHCNLQKIILPLPLPSTIAFKVLEYNQIQADLIYIDGSHEYEDVKTDIKLYKQLLTKKGIMFGDDYNDNWPGVKKAVNESFLKERVTIVDNNYWVYTND